MIGQSRMLEASRERARRQYLDIAIEFIRGIGVPVFIETCDRLPPVKTFFKGIWLTPEGVHLIPGIADIGEFLHESGHWALVLPEHRQFLTPGELTIHTCLTDFGVEAWNVAAADAAGIPRLAVFSNPNSFKGAGFIVYEQFDARKHPGIDLLEISKMSDTFPNMLSWFPTESAIRISHIIYNEPVEAIPMLIQWGLCIDYEDDPGLERNERTTATAS